MGSAPQSQVLQAVADRAREIAHADLGSIVLRGEHGRLEVVAVSGDEPSLPGREVTAETSVAGSVIETGETVVLTDRGDDPRGAAAPDLPLGPLVAVPLRNEDGVEGVLSLLWTREHYADFETLDIRLPQQYAEQAALALRVVRVRGLKERLALYEDRDRIGRDLHDLVIQRLFAIGLGLDNASRLAGQGEVGDRLRHAVDEIDDTIKEIRRTIFELGATRQTRDIRTAINAAVDRAARSLKVRPHVRFEGPVGSLVSEDVAPQLLAVVEEALSNVVRHARATRVDLVIEAGEQITLTVRDDGVGIPDGAVRSGLANMHERATQLGGSCSVESTAGQGTTVTWQVPAGPGEKPGGGGTRDQSPEPG